MEIKPIEKTKLAKKISNTILEMIRNNEWKPGSKIPTETELAAAFAVSRNVIREAVKTLETLGILESKVAKGTFVTLNAKENMVQFEFWNILSQNTHIKDLFEIRLIIEPEMAYYAAIRANEQEINGIKDFLNGKNESKCYENYGEYFESTYNFHVMVAKCAKNEILEKFLETIFEQIKQAEVMTFIVEKHIYTNQVGHMNILNAIEEKNPKKAKKLMFDHIYPVYAFFQE